jgi:hypothetical protein
VIYEDEDWGHGPGFVDWEIHPVDASRCKEIRVCPSDRDRMCRRGRTATPYDFCFDNCQHWAGCEKR